MNITVRNARAKDAPAAVETLRRSITELCLPDHGNDPEALKDWLANKTEPQWQQWIEMTDISLVVAELDNAVRGVGLIAHSGEIRLNYVHPDARLKGISRALLSSMEGKAHQLGLARCFLESTRTALRFYRANGYLPVRDAENEFLLEKTLGSST
ncbi:GNAT family N-acetyltransferase [Hyphomonas adhaerens]|uniref:GNAT family N-acetyltransferase n=1 Tax=Hyphomonas adhaerens TaxID=81029 RepID=UPI0023529A80|nr:GNAT family N-acetyltransferase [Hyphomonas adhaerens]